MIQVSYAFEVPKQRDSKVWKELRKGLDGKTSPNFETYIHWHRLQLQLQGGNNDQILRRRIKLNLEKLEKANEV